MHDLSDLLDVGVIWGMRAPSWIRRIGGSSGGTAWSKAGMVLTGMHLTGMVLTETLLRNFLSKGSGV